MGIYIYRSRFFHKRRRGFLLTCKGVWDNMIKAVVFDVDNTLYSYTKAHETAFNALTAYGEKRLGLSRDSFEKLHQETEHKLKEYMGDVAALHNRCIRYQVMLESRGLPLYPHVLEMNDLYWDTLLRAAVPFSGALKAVKMLKEQGMRIGIGTDMTARIQFRKLEVLGFLPYIDFLVSSEETGAEKPDPALFARCVEKAGCGKQECLFVGDSLKKDVSGAVSAGLKAVWYHPEDSGVREDGPPEITDMMQLLQIVTGP